MNVIHVITLGLVLRVSAVIGQNICYQYQNGAQLPNNLDCSTYYVCSHGEPKLFKCREPLLYDHILGVCNWAENVTCGQMGLPDRPQIQPTQATRPPQPPTQAPVTRPPYTHPPITQAPVTRPPTTQAPITRPPTPAVQPTRPPYQNWPNYPNYPGYPHYPYVEGIPENGGQNHQQPPPNFGDIEGRPEWVNNPHPYPQPQPETAKPEPEPVPTTNKPEPAVTQPPVTTTSKPVTTTLNPVTTTFKPATTTTQSSNNHEYYPGVITLPHNPNSPMCTKDGLYFAPHPIDCQKYFICEGRRVHSHQCGAGIHWDYIFSQCVHAETAFCFSEYNQDGRPEIINPTIRPETTIGVTGPIAIGQPPTQTTTAPENVSDPIVDCPGNQAFFAHKTDCRKYYICIGGIPIATSCPEKMAWDNDNLQCSEDAVSQCLSHIMASMSTKS